MQSKIHKYRYRYVDTYAHTWPHDDAEQHVASFPSRKDNEIVFAQEPWTDSLSATAAAPPKQEQLFREIDNYAKKKGEKCKKRKCEKHSKENSREVQLNLLLFAHTWKDFTEFCELRDWLKYPVQLCCSFCSRCCCYWQQVELFMRSASISSDFIRLCPFNKLL